MNVSSRSGFGAGRLSKVEPGCSRGSNSAFAGLKRIYLPMIKILLDFLIFPPAVMRFMTS